MNKIPTFLSSTFSKSRVFPRRVRSLFFSLHEKKVLDLFPLFLLFLYWALIFYLRGKVPDPQTFIESLKDLYSTYGYFLILFSAIMEAMIILGMYIPGSTVILLGAILAKTGVISFPLVFIFGTLGLLIGYSIDYLLGRFGWYHVLSKFGLEKVLLEAEKKLKEQNKKAIFLSFFMPSTASLLSTSAGILKMPYKKFILLALIFQSIWGLFWGNLAYFFGLPVLQYFQMKYFLILIAVILVVWFLRRRFKKSV